MSEKRKAQICALLKSIETGDEAGIAVVHPERYIQHNPQTREGGEGLADLFKRLSQRNPRVNIVRIFSDGNFVFGQTEYDFGSPRVGFEVFRFEGDHTVEHWDNIQPREGPNRSGHSMVDGPTEATDPHLTESNREVIRGFTNDVLIQGRTDKLARFIEKDRYTEHHPHLDDGLSVLHAAQTAPTSRDGITMRYERNHRLLADGNFVLSVNEGEVNGIHSSLYDLYRLADSKIVERWNTTETVPPRSEWQNDNGKF
jgi:predicted SnoaL-like aldol condensation-catalyzing enzyme